MEDLQGLNPELRLPVTPSQPEGYELKVPAGTRDAVLAAYSELPTARPPTFRTYVAKKGDTLPRIAKKHGVSVASLASANSLFPKSKIARGQEIMIPEKVAVAHKAAAPKAAKKKTPPTKIAQAAAPAGPRPRRPSRRTRATACERATRSTGSPSGTA